MYNNLKSKYTIKWRCGLQKKYIHTAWSIHKNKHKDKTTLWTTGMSTLLFLPININCVTWQFQKPALFFCCPFDYWPKDMKRSEGSTILHSVEGNGWGQSQDITKLLFVLTKNWGFSTIEAMIDLSKSHGNPEDKVNTTVEHKEVL